MGEVYDKRIAGFRSWKVDEQSNLTGIAHRYPWPAGEEAVASCGLGPGAPHVGHRCGFNAFYRFSEWEEQEAGVYRKLTSGRRYAMFTHGGVFDAATTVVGVVSASGRAILCETGWQSERARVEALIAYGTEMDALGGKVSVRPLLDAIAARYGVPVISPEEAEAFCSVEGLEVMEPLTGEESELPAAEHPFRTYTASFNFAPIQASLDRMNAQILDLAKGWHGLQASISDKPTNFQEAIEAKKNKGKFYDGLDTKKGLDRPHKNR